MSLELKDKITYTPINSTFAFSLKGMGEQLLFINIVDSKVSISAKTKVDIILYRNLDVENTYLLLYKIKNNSLCNYLLLIYDNYSGSSAAFFIPLMIDNEYNITLPNLDSTYEHYFTFTAGTTVSIFNTQAVLEYDGSNGSKCYLLADGNYAQFIEFTVNDKLKINCPEGQNPYSYIYQFFNGENISSNNFQMFGFDINSYQIKNKNNEVVNDNGFIQFLLTNLNFDFFKTFIYDKYLLLIGTDPIVEDTIIYAEINDEFNSIINFGKIENLDKKGGYFAFPYYEENFLYINYLKYNVHQDSTNCIYKFQDNKSTFKGTINFADGYTLEQEFNYEIGYVETIYIASGNCTFKFYNLDNELKTTIQQANADSYKYAETITINGNQYPINTKQQITINSDFTIQVNNGVVAFYYAAFKNDTKYLQEERLQENTLPVYKGETPTKEGFVFVGWEPSIAPVTAYVVYTAVFEKAPYTITIEDSSDREFTVTRWDTFTHEKSREFTKTITRIGAVINPYIENSFYLTLTFGEEQDFTICTFGYDERNIIPRQLKIGDNTYNIGIGTGYDIRIENNAIFFFFCNSRFSIRFLNYDNSVLESKYVYEGETPTYTGDAPYRKGYDFTGWSPTLYPANKSQDYTATFKIQTFTIRFLNDDGSVLETQTINYGTTPAYSGETPTKEGYTFNGWAPFLYPANKNQDYTATYRNSAFSLTLYKNTAENNRIDKTEYLTSVGEITGYLRQETNIINPSIVIEYAGVIDFNYVFISAFNRYYFVNNITSVRTHLWRLDMSCDVLMTYRDTILNYECYVSRNENLYNEDIEDNYLPLEYEKVVEVTNLYNDTYNYGKVFLEGKYSVVFTTIYTGKEYQVDDEQVETEFQDLEGNILEVSSISLGASNYRCMGIIKNNILGTLNKLIEKTINADDLASYIISLIVFPVDGNELIVGALTPEKLLIKNDDTSITVTQGDVSYPNGGVLKPILANQFTITPKYNNFLDYEPYTTYEIYLPFYGWLKLNSYQILNEQLVVTYCPQVDSEQCSIIISKGSFLGKSREVIAEVTCQLGIQIPINSTNVERINREKTANVLNSVVGGITGVAMAGAGAAIGNPLMAMAGGMTAIGSITSGISKDMTLLPSAQSKSGSSYDGAMSDRTFKLRITYPKIAVDDLTKYAKYIGRPLQTNVKLNTLTGYTIVGGVHVENLATATDNEKTGIERQLRKGVII